MNWKYTWTPIKTDFEFYGIYKVPISLHIYSKLKRLDNSTVCFKSAITFLEHLCMVEFYMWQPGSLENRRIQPKVSKASKWFPRQRLISCQPLVFPSNKELLRTAHSVLQQLFTYCAVSMKVMVLLRKSLLLKLKKYPGFHQC